MVKYIIKRILLSILILFGVSVIIYTMVRLMPNDYIDHKYQAQISQGTLTQDDLDNFKALYGLYTPEARLHLTVDNENGTFDRDVRKVVFDEIVKISNEVEDYDITSDGIGLYRNKTSRTEESIGDGLKRVTEKRMELTGNRDDATLFEYHYYLSVFEDHKEKKEVEDNFGNVTEQEVVITKETQTTISKGTYSFKCSGGVFAFTFNKTSGTGNAPAVSNITYVKTSFGEKLGTILSGYFTWLGNLIKGDLGVSFKYEKPVGQVISENMWVSFAIAIVATILQFLIAIPLGISSATHQYSARDYIVTIFTMIGISLPTYFFAAIVIKLFAVDLGWLPSTGLINPGAVYPDTFAGFMKKLGDMSVHLILPIFVSVILSLGGLMRYTRTNTLEVLSADYIRTARAKGLSEKTVIYKHAFRNTLIPLATLLAGILPGLFGGMMITEQVFGIPGIGNLAYKALTEGDIPFVMGYNMFLAILTVIGTLLSDIMYSIVDPRVKLGR